MQELTDFPYQVPGEKRQQALNSCLATIRNWGLTMPGGAPLVLDFGLGRFDEIGEIEFWVANEEAGGLLWQILVCPGRADLPLPPSTPISTRHSLSSKGKSAW